jgi:hypothetical protein
LRLTVVMMVIDGGGDDGDDITMAIMTIDE